ncbi:hypothetical protein GCM10011586_05750 [Silvibacterium dinghuense]|nr:hypothetical protein GCM10011586_05750 [Silvibacterium dinghuense]
MSRAVIEQAGERIAAGLFDERITGAGELAALFFEGCGSLVKLGFQMDGVRARLPFAKPEIETEQSDDGNAGKQPGGECTIGRNMGNEEYQRSR